MIYLILLAVFAAIAKPQTYSDEVVALFKDLQLTYPLGITCMDTAINKMNSIASTYVLSKDKQYAIAMLNLYTQECPLAWGVVFYRTLNKQLRSGKPEMLWKRAEDILNDAIALHGESIFPILYRGCVLKSFTLHTGHMFQFNQFISTSLNVGVAYVAATQELNKGYEHIIYVIKDAKGLYLGNFSSYPSEQEVLLRSDSTFVVVKIQSQISPEGNARLVELQYMERVVRSALTITESALCD